MSSTSEREVLPDTVYPDQYYLALEPDFEQFTINGSVKIDLSIKKTTKFVVLNYFQIEFHEVKVDKELVTKIKYDEKIQQVIFESPQVLIAGTKSVIEIKYTGILNDKHAGFYRASFKNEIGETKYCGATQFQPTDARRAFPCFDEPELKSKFLVTLIADENFTCLANSLAIEEKKLDNGKKAVIFDNTPLLSTYLVAFVVGDLRFVECNDYKIPVRVYTTPGLEDLGKFAAKVAAKGLKYFAKAFDIEYYLPHLYFAAGEDFALGAMENSALVTARAGDLLIDEQTGSTNKKLTIENTVYHEIAHHWFGNLVTMKWWNDLWLNEAYATYCSNIAFDKDESFCFQNFEAKSLRDGFKLDGLRASHPVEVAVNKAGEIYQIFDAISYYKGSSLLRMLAFWLGQDVFFKGVSSYLKRHEFGNAETVDLWNALSEASGKDVFKVMNIWTTKVGYPVMNVKENGKKITLTQNRFLSTGDVIPEEDEILYPIFVNLKTDFGVEKEILLTERELTIDVDTDFFKINADTIGFYRTLYSSSRWTKLGQAGIEGKLSVQDRTGIISDAFALAVSGYTSTIDFLNLSFAWINETEFVVWEEILNGIDSLKKVWRFYLDEKISQGIDNLIEKLILKKLNSYKDWSFDLEPLEQRLKGAIFNAAANKDPKVIEFIDTKFQEYVNGDKSAIHPNIKSTVFETVSKNGGVKEYEQILNILKTSDNSADQSLALRSLGLFQDPELISRTLKMILDPKEVSNQIALRGLRGLMAHRKGTLALWEWLKENWEEISIRFSGAFGRLGAAINICASNYLVEGGKEDVIQFFKDKNIEAFDKGLQETLDIIDVNGNWLKRDGKVVAEWLKENGFLD